VDTNSIAVRSGVGLKAVVAASGIILFGWVALHLLGNLTLFRGAAAADGYAALLRRLGPLLWVVRAGVVLAAGVHVWAVATLAARTRGARGSLPRATRAATLASRSMRLGGALLLAFVAYHLLHLTFGCLHPDFQVGAVHHNVVQGLAAPPVALAYLAASGLLGLHLAHGLWAALGSLGIFAGHDPRRARPLARAIGAAFGLLFASIPLAVLVGVLR
jgi:succinate dehydrogenase / fumarate reductase, cytochrome b subunit